MPRKISRKGLVRKLDKFFSLYIRQRNAIDGYVKCVTCNTLKHWKEVDAGHFCSRRHYSTRWNTLNIRNIYQYLFVKNVMDLEEEKIT